MKVVGIGLLLTITMLLFFSIVIHTHSDVLIKMVKVEKKEGYLKKMKKYYDNEKLIYMNEMSMCFCGEERVKTNK